MSRPVLPAIQIAGVEPIRTDPESVGDYIFALHITLRSSATVAQCRDEIGEAAQRAMDGGFPSAGHVLFALEQALRTL